MILLVSAFCSAGFAQAHAASGDRHSPDRRDDRCVSCHRELALGYRHTPHNLTSQLPSAQTILGSFAKGSNRLQVATAGPAGVDPDFRFEMEIKDGRFYETEIASSSGHEQRRSEPIDLVIGSGVRGQSYLYWRGDELYQLPLSYWSDGQRWINSPGFRAAPPDFNRPISPRCLECHLTSIQPLLEDPESNRYLRSTAETGMACERCHGPSGAHIERMKARSAGDKGTETAILNPAKFSRDRQVDLCALCHSGARQRTMAQDGPYVPGEPLEEYLMPAAEQTTARPDVHANQVGLLKRSRCYLSSPAMSCSTCHDNLHSPERAAASYSTKCLSCHRVESCGIERKLGPTIANNCIDCHMPVQQTQAIVSQTAGTVIRTRMRTHWIKVYPAEGGQ